MNNGIRRLSGLQPDAANRFVPVLMMMEHTKNTCRLILKAVGVLLYHCGLARWVIGRSDRARVVLYHAIENWSGSYTNGLGITVSPETFEIHLQYYQRYYQVVSMNQYLNEQTRCLKEEPELTAARLLITFDDGYASVMDNALPLLEAYEMPATTYLIGNAVRGRMIWVNRLNQALNDYSTQTLEILGDYPGFTGLSRRGIINRIQTTFEPRQIELLIEKLESTIPELTTEEEKLFCTPEDIRQMQSRGMEFGFHSNDHWNLGHCKDSELEATLVSDDLDSLLTSNTFAYPFGYFAPSAIGRLTRKGYRNLLTVGTNNDKFSKLHMDRTEMFESDFARMFARLEIEEPFASAARRWCDLCRSQVRSMTGRKTSGAIK